MVLLFLDHRTFVRLQFQCDLQINSVHGGFFSFIWVIPKNRVCIKTCSNERTHEHTATQKERKPHRKQSNDAHTITYLTTHFSSIISFGVEFQMLVSNS